MWLLIEDEKLLVPRQNRVPEMDRWLESAARSLSKWSSRLESLRELERAHPSGELESGQGGILTRLVEDVPRLERAVARVRHRRALVLRIRQQTMIDMGPAWENACREIRELEVYRGLDLPPQEGLVPLGQNSLSGLWEFWHPQSGPCPEWARGRVRRQSHDQMGIVFVLLPGGFFHMGTQPVVSGPNYDPDSTEDETPVMGVSLEPFFMAKYEMTQSQWRVIMLEAEQEARRAYRHGPQTPIESISWRSAMAAMRRAGLTLPTEAQWEYACRSGTSTPWFTGKRVKSLDGYANLADQSTKGHIKLTYTEGFNDGYPRVAPVGTFKPNRWGFYNMHGNVTEWCRGHFVRYSENLIAPGSGLLRGVAEYRVSRGGSYYHAATATRSGYRHRISRNYRGSNLGIRPSRPIER